MIMSKSYTKNKKHINYECIIDNINDVTKIGLNTSNLICVKENTPQILLDIIPNMNDYPMLIEIGKLKSALGIESNKRNTHHVSINFIKNLPNVIANPFVVFYHSGKHSYNLISFDNDIPITICIKPNLREKYNNIEIKTNKLSTIFDISEDINVYLEDSISKVLFPDITKKEVISMIAANTAVDIDNTSTLKISFHKKTVK